MKLTDTSARNLKAKEKKYRIGDGDCLYLEVPPTGNKVWRYRWKEGKTDTYFDMGGYPAVSLKEARAKASTLNDRREKGLTPDAYRAELNTGHTETADITFKAVYDQWIDKHKPPVWSQKHFDKTVIRAEKHILPFIGHMGMAEITPPVILNIVLRPLEARGIHDTAHRAKSICSMVYQYAVAAGLATFNPTWGLEKAITSVKKKHYAAITTPLEVGKLMLSIDRYHGSAVVHCALRLMPLVFLRTQELRMGRWDEVYFDDAEWRIPTDRMKMDNLHIVPLARQALDVLRQLHSMTGNGPFMFPGSHRGTECMSDNTINMALRRMGYTGDVMTGHGFRSMASTLLNELGWNSDYIERQLAHVDRNQVRAAYNRASYLAERREMMQAWADYLDELRGKAREHSEKTSPATP